MFNNGDPETAIIEELTENSLQIVVRVRTTYRDEFYWLGDISVGNWEATELL